MEFSGLFSVWTARYPKAHLSPDWYRLGLVFFFFFGFALLMGYCFFVSTHHLQLINNRHDPLNICWRSSLTTTSSHPLPSGRMNPNRHGPINQISECVRQGYDVIYRSGPNLQKGVGAFWIQLLMGAHFCIETGHDFHSIHAHSILTCILHKTTWRHTVLQDAGESSWLLGVGKWSVKLYLPFTRVICSVWMRKSSREKGRAHGFADFVLSRRDCID